MEKDKGNQLIRIQHSLATLESDPSLILDSAMKINSQVHDDLGIERLLHKFNEELFESEGEVRPFSQRYSINPESAATSSEEQVSRFNKLFSVDYQVEEAYSGSELYVESKKLEMALDKDYNFKGVGIKIYQSLDIQNERFTIHVLGKLYFGKEMRYQDDRRAYLNMMSQGRFMQFSLNSVPSGEEVSTTLAQHTMEILQELEEQGYIKLPQKPDNQSEKSEPPVVIILD